MKQVILIAGPTASGKSAFAIKLAKDLGGVIINADSMQIYSDLRVLTARPSEEEEGEAPHRLYGVMDGQEICSAAHWSKLAMAEIEACWDNDQMPILVGGTGMYFRFLVEGMAAIPEISDQIRADVRARCDEEGSEVLHDELLACDPVSASRIAPGDSQRICRALEVYISTGKALSAWQQENIPGPLTALDKKGHVHKFVLETERSKLYDRCNRRFDMMLDMGAMDEVKGLMARELPPSLPLMKALGYPSLSRFQTGEISYEEAVEDGKMQTRRFAKRQMTWFRNQFKNWNVVDAQQMERYYAKILNIINNNALTE